MGIGTGSAIRIAPRPNPLAVAASPDSHVNRRVLAKARNSSAVAAALASAHNKV
jgi:hypothetical protein